MIPPDPDSKAQPPTYEGATGAPAGAAQYPPPGAAQTPPAGHQQYPSAGAQYPGGVQTPPAGAATQYPPPGAQYPPAAAQFPTHTGQQYPAPAQQVPMQTGQQYPAQAPQQYPMQTGQQFPMQSPQQYPMQTGQQYPMQTPQQYPMQSPPMMQPQGSYMTAVTPQNLGQFSMPVKCPNCGQTLPSRTEYVPGTMTHIWAVVLGLLTCLCCIPYLIDGMKDVHHYCSNCNIPLAIWHRNGGGVQVLAHAAQPGAMQPQPMGMGGQPAQQPMASPDQQYMGAKQP